jgi:hypothetical protein
MTVTRVALVTIALLAAVCWCCWVMPVEREQE